MSLPPCRWHESWVDENDDTVPALKDLKYDIGNMLNKAIAAIEDENDTLAGVLKNNIDFNAVKGKTKFPTKNGRTYWTILTGPSLCWLTIISSSPPTSWGAAYEYLIKYFADSAGKRRRVLHSGRSGALVGTANQAGSR